jgi:ABC-type metal ion transport system substrate-binding protein
MAAIFPELVRLADNPLKLKLELISIDHSITKLPDSYTAAAMNGITRLDQFPNLIDHAIAWEIEDSPIAHITAAREKDKDDPKILSFAKAFRSKEIAEFILKNCDAAECAPALPCKQSKKCS